MAVPVPTWVKPKSQSLMTVFVAASTWQHHILLEWRWEACLQFIIKPWQCLFQQVHDSAMSYLSEDGEPVYSLSQHLGFLHLARVIFLECRHLCPSLQVYVLDSIKTYSGPVCHAFLEINHVSCLGDSRQDHLFNVLLCHHLLHFFPFVSLCSFRR